MDWLWQVDAATILALRGSRGCAVVPTEWWQWLIWVAGGLVSVGAAGVLTLAQQGIGNHDRMWPWWLLFVGAFPAAGLVVLLVGGNYGCVFDTLR